MRITLRDIEDPTELWSASYSGNLPMVIKHLKKNPPLEERASARRCTALHAAALMGHHEVVEKLLSYQKGGNEATNVRQAKGPHSSGVIADVNARDVHGFTPLQYAVSRLKAKTVAILIKFNADVSSVDKPDFAPVWIAANTLLDRDPDVAYGDTVFEDLEEVRFDMVRTLLVAGARLEYFQWGGPDTTIWELAIESRGDTRLLKLLLNDGWADPPITPEGNTIAHFVSKLPMSKCRAGADCEKLALLNLEVKNNKGETPLFLAIQRNKVGTVKYILEERGVIFNYDDLKLIHPMMKSHDLSQDMIDVLYWPIQRVFKKLDQAHTDALQRTVA